MLVFFFNNDDDDDDGDDDDDNGDDNEDDTGIYRRGNKNVNNQNQINYSETGTTFVTSRCLFCVLLQSLPFLF